MDRLMAMTTFARCVERRSFSAVGREMSLTQSTVSKLIASLERHLGGKLFARTTRGLALTAEGRRFYEQCRSIIEAVAGAEASFRTGREEVSGTLRIASSVAFGRTQLMSRMSAFLRYYPALSVDLQLADRFVDLVEEGIDVAFRIGELQDGRVIAHRFGHARRVTVAAPAYLAGNAAPARPEDLANHNCIVYTGHAAPNDWSYAGTGGACTVHVAGDFRSNNTEAIRDAALAGIGIAMSPLWIFAEDMRAGKLVPLLPDHAPTPLPVHAVLPTNRRNSANVRACVEFFRGEFERDPSAIDSLLEQSRSDVPTVFACARDV
jgi:DNA-binding transcriptional LysR family regulator